MEKILIAKILKPQGLKGELKCKLCNKNYSVIENVTEVFLNDKVVPTRVINKAFRNGYLYLTLSTIDCREKAELLKNFNVYADRTMLIVPDDEIIISDIIGAKVLSENYEDIGELIDVQNYGSADILVINQYKREYMVPFIKEIVKKIDVGAKVIIVDKIKYDEAKICD